MRDFDSIREKIKEDPQNFEGYRELGDYYREERRNVNQAFLCYEQAYALCEDGAAREELQQLIEGCREGAGFEVHPVSFVILSYNAKEMMIDCLESIRKGCVPGSYETVVVDNASEDGIRDYLIEQKDIILQLNEHNTSFAEGCNQGVRLASPENDIMLLNNDTIVPPFAMFYLRLGLYEAENNGAVGPMSNAGFWVQRLPDNFSSKEEWLRNAKNVHIPSLHASENKAWLVGFAMLIKRRAWEETGSLDERFVRGCDEDTDYGYRLNIRGYQCILCHNAFIYHYGSVSFMKDPESYYQTLRANHERLIQKLGIDFMRFESCQKEMVGLMELPEDGSLSVLEINCGFAQTLSSISYKYPDSYTVGIEADPIAAKIGNSVANVICADLETDELPFARDSFDYILCSKGIDAFKDVVGTMKRLKQLLKPSGKIMILQRNLMSGWNLMAILSGKFETCVSRDEGARHLYTQNETLRLMHEADLTPIFIMKMTTNYMNEHPQEKEVLTQVSKLPGVQIGEDFHVASYITLCSKKNS